MNLREAPEHKRQLEWDFRREELAVFLDEIGLRGFEAALLHVTGLRPCLQDLVQHTEDEDLVGLLQHGMKKPQLRKLCAELQSLRTHPTTTKPASSIDQSVGNTCIKTEDVRGKSRNTASIISSRRAGVSFTPAHVPSQDSRTVDMEAHAIGWPHVCKKEQRDELSAPDQIARHCFEGCAKSGPRSNRATSIAQPPDSKHPGSVRADERCQQVAEVERAIRELAAITNGRVSWVARSRYHEAQGKVREHVSKLRDEQQRLELETRLHMMDLIFDPKRSAGGFKCFLPSLLRILGTGLTTQDLKDFCAQSRIPHEFADDLSPVAIVNLSRRIWKFSRSRLRFSGGELLAMGRTQSVVERQVVPSTDQIMLTSEDSVKPCGPAPSQPGPENPISFAKDEPAACKRGHRRPERTEPPAKRWKSLSSRVGAGVVLS